MAKLSETLKERGYVHQISSKKLEEITDGEKRTVYLGVDPTADSMHVGHLQGMLVLRRFLEDGHKVILLTGGGTGMIGDPGGKSEERNLLDAETLARNAEMVSKQMRQVFGTEDFIEENNLKWLGELKLIEFLRDVGKHFTVNAMVKKDIVSERLKKESPLSFTEFSYSLLQAYDYMHLNEEYGCDVQVGGSDQWTNILAGVDFVRRTKEKEVFALTWPLIVDKKTGKKFGKSEGGTIWLDKEKTPPFEFYQFWLNTDDESLEEFLLKMTMLSKMEITAALELHKRDKRERHGQHLLAREITTLVHGAEETTKAEKVSHVLFGESGIAGLSREESEILRRSAPSCAIEAGDTIGDALVEAKLASSKREVRQFLKDKAVSLNGEVVTDEKRKLIAEDFHNDMALLKRGKKNVCVLTLD